MQFDNILKLLTEIGMTSNEAKMYLTILYSQPCTIGEISKKSNINRTSTYDCIDRLLETGLINYVVKDEKKWFECTNPDRILEMIREREEKIDEILPLLQNIYNNQNKYNTDGKITLHKGYGGVMTVFQQILREAKSVDVMDSEGQLVERVPAYARYFIKQLDKRNIKVRYLVRNRGNLTPSKKTEIRFIKKSTVSDAVINIYDNKIVFFVWVEPPEAVVIENRAAAQSLRYYFEMIWNMAKKRE